GLAALAADAARRAHALAIGATTSAGLELDHRTDLARWAAGLSGPAQPTGGLSLETLARAAGVTKRQLEKDARAWASADAGGSADASEPSEAAEAAEADEED
ncbi:MAG: hypothetical protein ACYCS2_05965, partial [Acidimicrobiales bacterium]